MGISICLTGNSFNFPVILSIDLKICQLFNRNVFSNRTTGKSAKDIDFQESFLFYTFTMDFRLINGLPCIIVLSSGSFHVKNAIMQGLTYDKQCSGKISSALSGAGINDDSIGRMRWKK
jgi:hypothetical protein